MAASFDVVVNQETMMVWYERENGGSRFGEIDFSNYKKGKDVLKAAYCATKSDVEVAF